MKEYKEFKGLTGNFNAFKEEVADAETITFIGAPGTCTPFAELFAYTVRRDKKCCYITLTDISSAKKIELTPAGMQLTEKADPKSDAIAILGGMSMPKNNVSIDEMKELIEKIKKENTKIIGLCYMNMFEKAGWEDEIGFDCVINGDLNGYVKK